MSISSIDNQTQAQCLVQNNTKWSLGGYTFSPSNIPKNLCRYALPLITLYALSNIPTVDSGPLSYSACVLGCTAVLPPSFPACIAMCSVTLFLPSP